MWLISHGMTERGGLPLNIKKITFTGFSSFCLHVCWLLSISHHDGARRLAFEHGKHRVFWVFHLRFFLSGTTKWLKLMNYENFRVVPGSHALGLQSCNRDTRVCHPCVEQLHEWLVLRCCVNVCPSSLSDAWCTHSIWNHYQSHSTPQTNATQVGGKEFTPTGMLAMSKNEDMTGSKTYPYLGGEYESLDQTRLMYRWVRKKSCKFECVSE